MARTFFLLLLAFVCSSSALSSSDPSPPPPPQVTVDWDNVIRTSQTYTTLQVVSNPILDRELTSPNGTVFPNPIHDQAWQSLEDLGADFVRFVPWFPYPWKSVAELFPPLPGKNTSWNFTYIIPQLYDFMNATHAKNHSTVINFSTQPCWLFNAADCSVPSNPDETDFGYVRGDKLLDSSAKDLAAYYGRLLRWMMKGSFVDENGVEHTGGPAWSNMTYWEVFNEAEHGYTQEWYTHDYDVVVNKIREEADTDHRLRFVGIGGADPSWIPYFLNRSNHADPEIPLDLVSVHFYASCNNRTDPTTYADGFFSGADGFVQGMIDTIIPARDQHSPSTKLDLDELGVIMPDDNDASFNITANLPDIYWNAAGAMYAYLFGRLAPLGVEVLGHSQLAGSPKIPEWGIPLPQYPSVSLLDWRTGYGNARYWALKLLLEHFAPGDLIINTTLTTPNPPPVTGTNPFCGEVNGPNYGSVHLECLDTGSVMTKFDFADWGTPQGSCQHYFSGTCTTTSETVMAWVSQQCLNQSSCDLQPYPALGDPCVEVVKKFVVQAHCSGPNGGAAIAPVAPSAFALAFVKAETGVRKILLINTQLEEQDVVINESFSSARLSFVDPTTAQAAAPNGIGEEVIDSNVVHLRAFSVAVLTLPSA